MRLTLYASVLVIVLGALLPRAASAQSASSATSVVRTRHDAVRALLRRPATTPASRAARQRAVWDALASFVDYREIARRSLAGHWDTLTAAQRDEFVDLLTQIVQRQYASSLEQVVDYEITYGAEQPAEDDVAVETTARSRTERRRPPISVVYTLHRVDGAWRVCDLATDGSGTVATNRASFNRTITREGWEGLLARLRERADAISATH